MKKIVFLAAALMASMFILTSCEKENVAEMIEPKDVINPCNYVLVKEGFVDEYGNFGNLYADEYNPDDSYFVIIRQTRSHSRPFTGTLHWKEPNASVYGIYRRCCDGAATNCWNDNGHISFPHGGDLPKPDKGK